jgi:hypothetical protein
MLGWARFRDVPPSLSGPEILRTKQLPSDDKPIFTVFNTEETSIIGAVGFGRTILAHGMILNSMVLATKANEC